MLTNGDANVANAIQTRPIKASPIQWFEPSIDERLAEPLRQAQSQVFAYLPVVDEQQAAAIPALIIHYRAGLAPSTDDDIERMITKIALLYPGAKLSDKEMDARLELYTELLRDIPYDLLTRAFRTVAQNSRFFPTVAEIREAAADAIRERRSKIHALMMLKMKHEQEWVPPIAEADRVAPGDTARLLAEVSAQFGRPVLDPTIEIPKVRSSACPKAARRDPTDADYAALGVTAEMLAASRAADAAEAAAPRAPSPPIVTPLCCPACGQPNIQIIEGHGICESVGCSEMWRVDQAA